MKEKAGFRRLEKDEDTPASGRKNRRVTTAAKRAPGLRWVDGGSCSPRAPRLQGPVGCGLRRARVWGAGALSSGPSGQEGPAFAWEP